MGGNRTTRAVGEGEAARAARAARAAGLRAGHVVKGEREGGGWVHGFMALRVPALQRRKSVVCFLQSWQLAGALMISMIACSLPLDAQTTATHCIASLRCWLSTVTGNRGERAKERESMHAPSHAWLCLSALPRCVLRVALVRSRSLAVRAEIEAVSHILVTPSTPTRPYKYRSFPSHAHALSRPACLISLLPSLQLLLLRPHPLSSWLAPPRT